VRARPIIEVKAQLLRLNAIIKNNPGITTPIGVSVERGASSASRMAGARHAPGRSIRD